MHYLTNPNKTNWTHNQDFAVDDSTNYSIGALRCKVRFFTIVASVAHGCTVYTHLRSKGNIHHQHNDFPLATGIDSAPIYGLCEGCL